MLMVIPGHIVFVYTIKYFKEGTASPTKLFVFSYVTAAFIQVRKAAAQLGSWCPARLDPVVATCRNHEL
jgi:hypothetical protein